MPPPACAAALFVASLLASSGVALAVLLRLPEDHFVRRRRPARGALRVAARNLTGMLLVAAGLVLALPGVPGHGLLTLAAGLLLLDFPGKRRLERSLAEHRRLMRLMNQVRRRFHRPPLLLPPAGARRDARWLLPNLVTLLRVPLAALVWLDPANPFFVLCVVAAAGLTDIADGWLARRLGTVGGPGAWLDPLCDKVFMLSTLVAVGWCHHLSAWILLAVATREWILLPLLAVVALAPALRRRFRIRPDSAVPGKTATVAQFAAIAAFLFAPDWATPAALLAGATGLFAAAYYVRRALVSAPCRE